LQHEHFEQQHATHPDRERPPRHHQLSSPSETAATKSPAPRHSADAARCRYGRRIAQCGFRC
jgi:hypothetical protein